MSDRQLRELLDELADTAPTTDLIEPAWRRSRRVRRRRIVFAAGTIVAVLGVILGVLPLLGVSIDPAAGRLEGRTFRATAVTEGGGPKELVRGTAVMLRFTEQDRLEAHAGCDIRRADVEFDGSTIEAGSWSDPMLDCRTPKHKAQEEWLFGVLDARPSWRFDGDALVVTGRGAEVRLVARDSDQLLGRTFESTRVVENGQPKELADDTVIRIEFIMPGMIEAQAGCNFKGGPIDLANGRIRAMKGLATTDMNCAGSYGRQDDWLGRHPGRGAEVAVGRRHIGDHERWHRDHARRHRRVGRAR